MLHFLQRAHPTTFRLPSIHGMATDFVLACASAIVLMGIRSMMRFISVGLVTLFLSSCSDSDAPSSEDPGNFIEASAVGYQAAPALAIGEGATLVWFKALVSGSTVPEGQAPAKIGRLEIAKKCSFPRPSANETLVQVQTSESGLPTGIVALSDAQVQALSEEELQDPSAARQRAAMKVVDVVVTDTRGPIYLVLAGGNDIVWNIEKAPNSVISHVAIIGGDNAGIANLDPSVPVTALTGKAAKDCGVAAARLPKSSWTIVAQANEGDMAAIDSVKLQTEKYNRYSSWFHTTFGKDSEAVTIGIARMSHALIGTVPASLEARLPYRGILGSTVLLAPTRSVFYSASPDDYAAKIRELLASKSANTGG
jgi:hypothetical protein